MIVNLSRSLYHMVDIMIYKLINVVEKLTVLWNKNLVLSRGIELPCSTGGWSIGYDDILIIDQELERFMQRECITVLEFGSGISTFSIVTKLEAHFKDRYKFFSIEADHKWQAKTELGLKKSFPDAENVKLIRKSYSESEFGNGFNLEEILANVQIKVFDFIFVDAPPDVNGENIRLVLCQQIIPFLSEKSVLILHDTNRINEQFAVSLLKEKFLECESYNTEKGITVFAFPKAKS